MEYAELQEKFPFLSCVKYANNEYVGILQNQDNHVTSIYVYDLIKTEELKQEFLDLGEIWWWESNRLIPINIFLRKEVEPFKYCIMTMNSKDVKVSVGPTVNLNNMSIKRVKRKNVQLIKKIKT